MSIKQKLMKDSSSQGSLFCEIKEEKLAKNHLLLFFNLRFGSLFCTSVSALLHVIALMRGKI